jgi:hypothetical protein
MSIVPRSWEVKAVPLVLHATVMRIRIERIALVVTPALLAEEDFFLDLTIDARSVITGHDLLLMVNGLLILPRNSRHPQVVVPLI